jgi:hypothetical protein
MPTLGSAIQGVDSPSCRIKGHLAGLPSMWNADSKYRNNAMK